MFCFAHLQSCHNGWASNISFVVDTGCAGIHHSKYQMPIHYNTIDDGQNKKSHRLFSNFLAALSNTQFQIFRANLFSRNFQGYHICFTRMIRNSLNFSKMAILKQTSEVVSENKNPFVSPILHGISWSRSGGVSHNNKNAIQDTQTQHRAK